jgi:hypothetical protein
MKTKTILLLTTAIAAFSSFPDASANTINSGSVSGAFSSPVLTGAVIDLDGKTLIPVDNTATGVFTGFGTNAISWGSPTNSNSTLTFTGKSFSGVAPGQVFDLGTITYRNGNSFRETLIFGATLTLTANLTQGGSVDPSVSSVDFLSTANHLLPNGQPDPTFKLQDADFLSFSAFPQTFNVFENSTASAELFGMIVGDPQLVLTGIELNPDQSNNGFIGHGVPSTPDSGDTLALAGIALAALAVFGLSSKTAGTV